MTFSVPATRGTEAAMYLWNGTLNEFSGSGAPNLSLATGTTRWADVMPGVKGFCFDGSTRLVSAAQSALLEQHDVLTLEMLATLPITTGTNTPYIMLYENSGELLGANIAYGVGLNAPGGGSPNLFRYVHEHGAGVNDELNSTTGVATPSGLHYIFVRRQAASGGTQLVEVYDNDVLVASGTLTANAGGTDAAARLHLGADSANTAGTFFRGTVAFVRITAASISNSVRSSTYAEIFGSEFARKAP